MDDKTLHQLEAVSYTHLDVYKRQDLQRAGITFSHQAFDAVSYTHLDVYKRQRYG